MAIAKAGKIWQIAKRWHIRDRLSTVFRVTVETLSSVASEQTVQNSLRLSVFNTGGMNQGLLWHEENVGRHPMHFLPHFTLNSAIRFAFGGLPTIFAPLFSLGIP